MGKTYHCTISDKNGKALQIGYTTEKYMAEMDAKAYIEGFRRVEYFVELCRQCKNYGHRYGCPPFDDDALASIAKYTQVRVFGVKIIPEDKNLPLEAANQLMEPVIAQLNKELLEEEKALDGFGLGFVGTCPYCGKAPCARLENKPCRHPDKVRPSLEAFGFDVGKTAEDLLGVEIKWSHDGLMPEYLLLVYGIFYHGSTCQLRCVSR